LRTTAVRPWWLGALTIVPPRLKGLGVLRQNDCTPDWANGTFDVFPAWFFPSDIVTAAGQRYFTSMKLRFPGVEPAGHRTEALTDCYVSPPAAYIPKCP
jgi:hypothetical protein